MAYVSIIISIIFSMAYQGKADSFLGESSLHLEKYGQCPDRLNMSNSFFNVSLNNVGLGKVKIFGKFKIGTEITSPASIKCVIHKCASKEEPDTCEYYYTYNSDNICDILSKKNMPWENFMKQTDFPRKCPMKKGIYSLDGVEFDASDMLNFPLLYGYWKVRSSGKQNGKLFFCSIAEFGISKKQAKRRRQKN